MRHYLFTGLFGFMTLTLVSCSKGAEPPKPVQSSSPGAYSVVCSYSPSQHAAVLALSSATGGSAITAAAVANAAGLTAVAHSSGAYIFTGSAGYVAGTLGGAAAVPAIVTLGVIAGGSVATLELICVPNNYPDIVAKLTRATEQVYSDGREATRRATAGGARAISPIVADVKSISRKTAQEMQVYLASALKNSR